MNIPNRAGNEIAAGRSSPVFWTGGRRQWGGQGSAPLTSAHGKNFGRARRGTSERRLPGGRRAGRRDRQGRDGPSQVLFPPLRGLRGFAGGFPFRAREASVCARPHHYPLTVCRARVRA